MTLKQLLVMLLLVASAGWVSASAPTPAEVLVAARQAALEAKSRGLMMQVAELSCKSDPAQALQDYRAAIPMQDPDWGGGRRWQSDGQLAAALTSLGDAAAAKEVVLSSLEALLAEPDARQPMLGGSWVAALGYAAEAAYPFDREKALAVLPVIEKYLPTLPEGQSPEALAAYLRLLAFKDPATAYQRAKADTRQRMSLHLIRNLIVADPGLVAAHGDEIFDRGDRFEPESTDLPVEAETVAEEWEAEGRMLHESTVKVELAAALFRQNPQKGMDAALKYGLDDPDRRFPRTALALAIKEKGLGALPRAFPYEKLYASLAGDLAQVDADLGLALARSLEDTPERIDALASVCKACARTSPEQADAAVRDILAVGDQYRDQREGSLRVLLWTLSDCNEKTTEELFRRLNWGEDLTSYYGTWWKAYRRTAEALVPELPPQQQFYAITGIIALGKDILTPAEKIAWAQKALANPESTKTPQPERLIQVLAGFSPELARQAWQALPPIKAGGMFELSPERRVLAVLPVAEAWEARQPRSGAPEVAELNRLLATAPAERMGRFWTFDVRARLAAIYIKYDAPLARQTATDLMEEVVKFPTGANEAVLTTALSVLAQVDAKAAQDFLAQVTLNDNSWAGTIRSAIILTVARRDPGHAWEMLQAIPPQSYLRQQCLFLVSRDLVKDAPAQVVRDFCDRWVAADPQVQQGTMAVMRCLLVSGRADRGELLLRYLDQVPIKAQRMVILNELGELGYAPVAFQDEVARRLEKAPGPEAQEARWEVVGARARQDWEGSQTLLQALPADRRGQALLRTLSFLATPK